MSALVLKMSVSLDGYVAPADGSTGWIAAGGSDDGFSWTVETVSNAGAHEYRLVIHPVVLGAGERLFRAPLTIEPVSTTVFSGGAVAHVFAAHP
jgi:hypothetical protein